MTPEERRLGAQEYLIQSEKSPLALQYAYEHLARSERTTVKAVAGWTFDRRADRLARSRMEVPHIASIVSSWLVKHRAEMLTRFLDVAEIPHLNCVVDVRTASSACSVERLTAAVRAVTGTFPPRDVGLYLDALEAQGASTVAHLAQARKAAQSRG